MKYITNNAYLVHKTHFNGQTLLFPAGGYGTRFLPATESMPKEMTLIVNKPLIE